MPTARPSDFYPITCDTYRKKLELLGELDEVARLDYNIKVKGKDQMEAMMIFDSEFIGKSQEIHRQINEIIDNEKDGWLWDDKEKQFIKNKPPLTNTWKPSLSKLDYVDDREADPFDPIENPLTYNIQDDSGWLSRTTTRITFTAMARNDDAYVWKDFGVDFFDGDFSHLSEFFVSALGANGLACIHMLSNAVDDFTGLVLASEDLLTSFIQRVGGNYIVRLAESDGGAFYADTSSTLTLSTLYSNRFQRVEAVSPFGTIYEYIFSAGPILVDTLSVALHTSKKNYRNNFGLNNSNSGAADTITGYFQNQDLQIPPAAAAIPPHMFQRVR